MANEENYPGIAEIILSELEKLEKVLDDPAAEVEISAFESHNIRVNVRPFFLPDDYWE